MTPETGHQGFLCRSVYVVEEVEVDKEIFICLRNDRTAGCPVIIYGRWVGRTPDSIVSLQIMEANHNDFKRIYVDIRHGLNKT